MSWAKDEWKQDLSTKVLQKIKDMENEQENLHKLRQQQELKIDGYVTALEKGKVDFEQERFSNAALQKEVQELTLTISNLEAKQERYVNEIKNKEKMLEYEEEILDKTKQKLKAESAKAMELQKSLDYQRGEAGTYAEKGEKMSEEIAKLKQEKAHISKENENYEERLCALTREMQTLRLILKENEQSAKEIAQENEKDNDVACPQEPVAIGSRSDAFLDILKKENTSLLGELEQLRLHREQMKNIIEERTSEAERNATKVCDMKMELQSMKKDLKDNKAKITKLECNIGSREREIIGLRDKIIKHKTNEERMKEELKTLKDQLEIKKQNDGLASEEQSDGLTKAQKMEEVSDTSYIAKENLKVPSEKETQQLYQENESLHEQIKWLRETHRVLLDNIKEKEERLKSLYDEQQEQHKKEEARLEKVEALLLDNAALKEIVQNLESEEKFLAGVQVCKSCNEDIKSNEDGQNRKRSAAGKNDSPNLETVTGHGTEDVGSQPTEGGSDATMIDGMEVDNTPETSKRLQMNDKPSQTDGGTVEEKIYKQIPCLTNDYHSTFPDKDADDDSSDVNALSTADLDNNLQHKILQVLVSLSTVQVKHEMVERGVSKCCRDVKTITQDVLNQVSDTENQGSLTVKTFSNIHCLANQLKALRDICQHCTAKLKLQTESIAGCFDNMRKEMKSFVQDEGKPNVKHGQVIYKNDTRSPERELSWDNFESECAFQLFKSGIDPLIKQIEEQEEDFVAGKLKNLEIATKNHVNEPRQATHTDKMVNIDNTGVEADGDGRPDTVEIALQLDDFIDVLRTLMDENNDRLAQRIESLLQHFEINMIKNISEKQKEIQQNHHTISKAVEKRDVDEKDTPENWGFKGGKTLEDFEMIKRKISCVQNLFKQLLYSIETTKEEKAKADSQIDLLTKQMRNMSSHHEVRYSELQNTLKTTSERDLSLQRQIVDLQTEKDDISCKYKESFEDLKKQESELARLSQEIKNIQTKSKENELKLKNKIEGLQDEKTHVWHNYKKASEEADERKKEIELLVAKMKKTEIKLVALFNTIGNIDDFLQRAKDMNLFQ